MKESGTEDDSPLTLPISAQPHPQRRPWRPESCTSQGQFRPRCRTGV